MNIYDMFLESKTTLYTKGFCLNTFPIEKDIAQYLLFYLAIGTLHITKGFSVNTKSYPAYGLIHVTEGTLYYRSHANLQNSVAVKENTLYLFDCHTSHTLSAKTDCYFTLLYFDGHPATYYYNRLLKSDSFLPLNCNCDLSIKLQNVLAIASEESIQKHLCLTDFLTSLIYHTTPSTVRIPAYLIQIKKFLDTDYYTNHTLEELESTYKTDRYRICREFKLHFQISPIQYLHQVRMKNAQLLLMERNMKIHEIAYEVGYENVNHFIHHFKKTAGITPAEYRKNILTS